MSKHTFSPGDIVRVVSSSVHIDYTPVKVLIGEICEIKKVYSDGYTFEIWQPNKLDWFFFRAHDIEPVTHEEEPSDMTGHNQDNQWRPIETSPRDGTMVIVASFDNEPEMASWEHGHWWDVQWGVLGFIPTHWVPSPKNPKKEEV